MIPQKISKPDKSELNDAENAISNSNVILERFQTPEKVQNIRLNPYANSFILYTPLPEIIKGAKLSQYILDIGVQNTQFFNYHGRSALNPHANPFDAPPILDKASPSTELFSEAELLDDSNRMGHKSIESNFNSKFVLNPNVRNFVPKCNFHNCRNSNLDNISVVLNPHAKIFAPLKKWDRNHLDLSLIHI